MEACLAKPEVKKKPQPPKPPPKPAKIKRSNPETLDACLEPLQPADAANTVSGQCEREASSSKTPKRPPRLKEKELKPSPRHSQRRSEEPENTKAGRELSPNLKTGKSEKNETNSETKQEKLDVMSELSGSTDSLSEHNPEKAGLFDRMFRKSPKPRENAQTKEENYPQDDEISAKSLPENNTKEKGLFGGIFKKPPKPAEAASSDEDREALGELSASNDDLTASEDDLSEKNTTKDKSIFSNMFKKKQKQAAGEELEVKTENELFGSSENLSDASAPKEKSGNLFSGLLKKTPKPAEETPDSADREALGELPASNDDLTASEDDLSEKNTTKDKSIFSNMFKKKQKQAGKELEVKTENELFSSSENLSDASAPKEKSGNLFSGLLRKTPKPAEETSDSVDREALGELSASNDDLTASEDDLSEKNTTKDKSIFSNMFKKPQKQAAGEELEVKTENELFGSSENLSDASAPKEKKGGLAGIFKRSSSIENLFDEEKGVFSGMFKKSNKPAKEATSDEESNTGNEKDTSARDENLSEATMLKEKTGGLAGYFKKSPKPAPRSVVTEDPLSQIMEANSDCDSLTESAKERVDLETGQPGRLSRRTTIKKKKRVVSFRVKKTSRIPKAEGNSEKMPLIEEAVELQELNPTTNNTESTVEVQPVEMVCYPSEDNPMETEEESDELLEWWNTVKGWAEWNETNNYQDNEEMALEQAADRVYMAARLFVRLFNQRGASLQHRILELLALADAADQFHKRTVTAAVGGGVASVAGSVATITGLILAPFTFGASIIVTAVGIGVATAGSIASATANITDTVHSNMDRKKLEKMIQGYQDEIKVIRECLEFVQAGMDTLQEWDFEKYSQSAAKKALNHNIKHVMKEGGRAGKALMINTDKLISTVQILGTAGGAAKAVQAISVTTGVMSALFLALDVFFLAKDSHELRKGAKTKFANKIRDVCKELQDGLLELNKVKTQLQKTMDGIEVEEYEEIEEVEVEVDDDLASDPKKLAELEVELDLLEEKLDKKMEEDEKKYKVMEKDQEENQKGIKKGENADKIEKEEDKRETKETLKKKDDKENNLDLKLELEESEQKNETVNSAKVKVVKDWKERKADKETVNYVIASKEKQESIKDADKKESDVKNKTEIKEKEKNKIRKDHSRRAESESKQEEQHGRSHLRRESELKEEEQHRRSHLRRESELKEEEQHRRSHLRRESELKEEQHRRSHLRRESELKEEEQHRRLHLRRESELKEEEQHRRSHLRRESELKEEEQHGRSHLRRESELKEEEQHGRSHLKRESERNKDAEGEVNTKREVECGNRRSKYENRKTEERGSNKQHQIEDCRMIEEKRVMHRRAETSVKTDETSRGSEREGEIRKKSHRSRPTREHCEQESSSSREEGKRRPPRTAAAHDEEKRKKDSARQKCESTRDRERRRSREGDGDTEGRPRHRGSGGRTSVLREDGLYI